MPNKNWKIRVNSPEHSVKIQGALFKLGASWKVSTSKFMHTRSPYLSVDWYGTKRYITHDYCPEYFQKNSRTEVFLQPDGTFAEQEFKQIQGENMKHKYAEILMACINKENIQVNTGMGWSDIGEHVVFTTILNGITGQKGVLQPEDFRVKPKTIMIGKHEVKAPISVAPSRGTTYFIVFLSALDYYSDIEWAGDVLDYDYLSRGIIHTTKEAAIAHAKALLSFTQTKE